MSDTDWKSLFEPRTKSDWLQKIEADARGIFAPEQLIHSPIKGIEQLAVQTRDDLRGLPHLDTSSIYNSLSYDFPANCMIGYPVSFSSDLAQTTKRIQQGIARGAEHFYIDPDPKKITSDQVLELVSSWPQNIHLHISLPYELIQQLPEGWTSNLSGKSSVIIQKIEHREHEPAADSPHLIPSYIPDLGPKIRSVAAIIPSDKPGKESQLGSVLREIDAYATKSGDSPFAVSNLLKQLEFNIFIGPDFYYEIARLKALRYLVVRFAKTQLPQSTAPLSIPIHAFLAFEENASISLPDRLLKSTTRAMAALLGGCSSILVESSSGSAHEDETNRLLINLQLMLRHEAHLGHVIDPAAGSYYVETLTHQIIQHAWTYYEKG